MSGRLYPFTIFPKKSKFDASLKSMEIWRLISIGDELHVYHFQGFGNSRVAVNNPTLFIDKYLLFPANILSLMGLHQIQWVKTEIHYLISEGSYRRVQTAVRPALINAGRTAIHNVPLGNFSRRLLRRAHGIKVPRGGGNNIKMVKKRAWYTIYVFVY